MAYPNPSFYATAPPPDEQPKPSPSLYSPPQGPSPTSLTSQQQTPQPTSTASLSSMPPQPANAPYTTQHPHQQEQPSHKALEEPEKKLVAVVTGILVIFVIVVSWISILSPSSLARERFTGSIFASGLFGSSKGILAASASVTFFNLALAIWLCTLVGRKSSRKSREGALALIPVTFAITAGCLRIWVFSSSAAAQAGTPLPDTNFIAVLLFSTLFAGLGGGALISYVASEQRLRTNACLIHITKQRFLLCLKTWMPTR